MDFNYFDHDHRRDHTGKDRKDRKHRKHRRRKWGIDRAFSWRCCHVSRRYQLDFSRVNDPCIPKRKHRFHCGC